MCASASLQFGVKHGSPSRMTDGRASEAPPGERRKYCGVLNTWRNGVPAESKFELELSGEFREFRVLSRAHCHPERGTSRRIRDSSVITREVRILRLRSQARSAQDDMHFTEGLELMGDAVLSKKRSAEGAVRARHFWGRWRAGSRASSRGETPSSDDCQELVTSLNLRVQLPMTRPPSMWMAWPVM